VRAFLARRRPELAIFLFGVLLRLSLNRTFAVEAGYDYYTHHDYVKWIAAHGTLPRFDLNVATYHPPLYYWFSSLLLNAGFVDQSLGWISIVSGCLRLGVVWAGLELFLPSPGQRFARVVALALLAVFPADLHLDAMATNEALSTLFAAAALVLLPFVLGTERPPRARHAFGAALGLALGLGLLTKISTAALILAAGLAAAVGLVRAFLAGTRGLRPLYARVAPLATALAVTAAVSGWFFARNYHLYGMLAPTGYDGSAPKVVAEHLKSPFLDRRSIGYVAGFDAAILDEPYYPTASFPHPRFWSVLVASTFADYFNYGFGAAQLDEPAVWRIYRPIRPTSFALSRWSVRGGALIALVAVAAWLWAARHVWRRREDGHLALLLVPLLAVLGQLAFAIRYPNDTYGPVKGAYLQFGTPPLFALVGLAVAWAWRRPRARVLAVLGLGGQVLVAAYSLHCCLPVKPLLAMRKAPPPPQSDEMRRGPSDPPWRVREAPPVPPAGPVPSLPGGR
jgi:hypothetical protein